MYYSGYVPVSNDQRINSITTTPLVRENRLYQADWLMRFYGFSAHEIVSDKNPHLDLEIDPKLNYALSNYHLFPVDPNTASYEMLLRVPGLGVKSAKMIVKSRRHGKIRWENLKKMGVIVNRAQYFMEINQSSYSGILLNQRDPSVIRDILKPKSKRKVTNQLSLF